MGAAPVGCMGVGLLESASAVALIDLTYFTIT